MSDNITTNSGSGGAVIGSDDIGGVHFQRFKMVQGSTPTDVDSSNPLNVTLGSSTVNAGLRTDVIMNGSSSLTPKFAKILTASQVQDVVAAVSGKIIRVVSLFMTLSASSDTYYFQTGGSTDLTGGSGVLAIGVPLVLPFNPTGWFQTVSGEKLNLICSDSSEAMGGLTYIEV